MITLKYYKRDSAVFLSHIDVLRHMNRTFRRAGINVKFSSGFNPHMLTKLGIPLPVGISSSCEYVTIDCDAHPDELLAAYNGSCVKGLEGIRAFETKKNPNLAGNVVCVDYSLRAFPDAEKIAELNDIINKKSLVLPYPTRKEPDRQKDIIPELFAIKAFPDSINVCVSANTMRADVLSKSFSMAYDVKTNSAEIWRYTQYVRNHGVLQDVDEYLEELSKSL